MRDAAADRGRPGDHDQAPGAARGQVTVRYFAAARAAAGVPEENVAAPASLAALIDSLAGRHGERMTAVLAACSYLVDGVASHDRAAAIRPGSVVDVLPPFAGG